MGKVSDDRKKLKNTLVSELQRKLITKALEASVKEPPEELTPEDLNRLRQKLEKSKQKKTTSKRKNKIERFPKSFNTFSKKNNTNMLPAKLIPPEDDPSNDGSVENFFIRYEHVFIDNVSAEINKIIYQAGIEESSVI